VTRSWLAEVRRVLILFGVAVAVGWFFDVLWPSLALVSTAYLTWHLSCLFRLERWLSKGSSIAPPQASGIWAEVEYQIARLIKRNRARKRKLKKFLKRYRDSTKAMPDATVVLNKHDQIEWWNSNAGDLLGLKGVNAKGQPITNFVRNLDFAEVVEEEDFDNFIRMRAPTNEDIVLSAAIVNYGDDQRLFIARDISRLERLEKMRRDFVANISHELRTPLAVLRGYLETISDDGAGRSSDEKQAYGQMQEQASRMQRIIEDLLLLSRLENDDPPITTPVPVGTMLERMVEDAPFMRTDSRHEISTEIDVSLAITGEESGLHSAFLNLISNAVRYTPDGGRIAVRWQLVDDRAIFEVSDNGEGIHAQHIPRLTERFYRVDRSRSRETGGTGLGLAIVRHVLDRHRAKLEIESRIGRGSVFRCCFPADRIATL